jgi:hypothetical protein
LRCRDSADLSRDSELLSRGGKFYIRRAEPGGNVASAFRSFCNLGSHRNSANCIGFCSDVIHAARSGAGMAIAAPWFAKKVE